MHFVNPCTIIAIVLFQILFCIGISNLVYFSLMVVYIVVLKNEMDCSQLELNL